MISRKHNSHIAYILTFSTVCLILSALSDVALSAWQPPIGIPTPSFGIDETYRMYDDPANRNPNLTYTQNAEGGFYTHYIDNSAAAIARGATDTANPYGTYNKPRLTLPIMPTEIPEGSVVEIHGGPYSKQWGWYILLDGSATYPIFVRGTTSVVSDMPIFSAGVYDTGYGLLPRGQYFIVENLKMYHVNIWISDSYWPTSCHHFCIRNIDSEGTGILQAGSKIDNITVVGYNPSLPLYDFVIYNCTSYLHGDKTDPGQVDTCGIVPQGYIYNVWVVDNECYDNGGDSIQVATAQNGHHIYIGRNEFHDEGENAIDIKGTNDVIISQNHCYNFYTAGLGSSGEIMTFHVQGAEAGPLRNWVIFNDLHDAQLGITAASSCRSIYIIGNTIHDTTEQALSGWNGGYDYIINNTIYNTGGGIDFTTSTAAFIENNIVANMKSATDNHIAVTYAAMSNVSDASYNLLYQDGGVVKIDWGSNTNYSVAQFKAAFPSFSTGCIEANPLFVDAGNDDLSLWIGSPGIDAGTSSGMVETVFDLFASTYGIDIRKDIEGTTRTDPWDNGAYEGSSSNPNNLTPVLQAIGDKSVDENVILTFNITATDPEGDPITYSAQGLPSGATFSGQTFTWTPSYSQAGSYSVTFRASDGNSMDSETITITVSNVNRAPVLGAISDQSVNENTLLSFSVNATDPDGQTLTYSVTGLPSGAALASQTFTWTPTYNQAGTFALTFTVDDGQAQDSQAITITVNNVNRAPVLSAINNKSVWSDDPLTFTIDATDPDGDAVTYSANAVPSGATFITETFDWTPTPAQIGSYNVTFYASDGQLQDSEAITITVNVDSLAPTITNLSPAAGAIQVPLNNLITLNVTDAGKGINPDSVKIKFKTNSNPNSTDIYFGDLDHDITLLGDCRRIGNNANYQFVFQPVQDLLYNDQTITITVNATDLAGNAMNEQYSFVTEMHLFGQNKLVNANLDNNDRPVTVCDSSGNIWAAWHTGSAGSRDIYIATLASGADSFGNIVQLTNDATDQCNPVLALDSNNMLYVVWQDNRNGNWDIYLSTSADGTNWSTEIMVNDLEDGQVNPFSNEINPAIVIDSQSPINAHVVWQDDLAGNQDICIAASSNGFITKTISQITSDTSDQVEPAVAADSANTIYVVWTDSRNGSSDIYGAASNSGPWTNVAVVSNVNNQSSPAIAAESTGTILHLLWVDDTPGDNDIYYASSSGGFQGISGSSIIDDTSGADQLEPTIAITGTTSNNDLKVFAGWQDWRNTDTDLYFAELNAGSGTNVFVNDGGSNAYQGEPAIGVDEYGCSYIVWADDRSTNTDIYYAGSTFTEPVALASALVSASAPGSTTIGVDPQSITNVDDVSIVLPSGACSYDVDVSIVTILNQQVFAVPCLGSYEFGPSGVQFTQPVTITIPYVYANSNGSTVPYWFNSQTGTISQQGISNIRDIVISPTLHAISFETTHFTPYYLLEGGGSIAGLGGGGGGGGGCSVSAGNEGNIVEFFLPYIVLIVVMAILKKRDKRCYELHNT